MGVNITIRNVPDDVRNTLAARAAAKGQSMQEYLRRFLIDESRRRSNSDVIRETLARNRGTNFNLSNEEIVKLVHEGRK